MKTDEELGLVSELAEKIVTQAKLLKEFANSKEFAYLNDNRDYLQNYHHSTFQATRSTTVKRIAEKIRGNLCDTKPITNNATNFPEEFAKFLPATNLPSPEKESVSNITNHISCKNNKIAPKNTRSSRWPVITATTLAIAGVALGIAIAVHLEMLAVGIVVGACCLVFSAAIIYCCSGPSNSLEKSSAEAATNKCCLGAPN